MRKPRWSWPASGRLIGARLRPAFRAAGAPIQRMRPAGPGIRGQHQASAAAHPACGAGWPAARCAGKPYPSSFRPVQAVEILGSAQPACARFATGRKRSRKRSTRSCCTQPDAGQAVRRYLAGQRRPDNARPSGHTLPAACRSPSGSGNSVQRERELDQRFDAACFRPAQETAQGWPGPALSAAPARTRPDLAAQAARFADRLHGNGVYLGNNDSPSRQCSLGEMGDGDRLS